MAATRILDHETGEWIDDAPEEEAFRILDPYAEEGIVEGPPRTDWIACISAGFKKDGYPQASRDGTIHLAPGGEKTAPELKAIIDEANRTTKRLTIAFPFDDLNGFIIQRFTRRTQTTLEVYGDANALTEIKILERDEKNAPTKVEHVRHLAGSDEYRRLKATCKVEVHVLFTLARWVGQQAIVVMPDGLSWYALRFTSRNSLQSIVGKLREIKERVTGGRIAGIPFDLWIEYRDVAGGTGQRRNVPVWAIAFKPPEAIQLSSGNLRQILGGALQEGEKLKLIPGAQYDIEDAIAEGYEPDEDDPHESAQDTTPTIDTSETSIERLTNGAPPAEVRHWEKTWFAAVDGSPLDNDMARAGFIMGFTTTRFPDDKRRWTDSLSIFLNGNDVVPPASEADANALIAEVERYLSESKRTAMANRVDKVAPPKPSKAGADADQLKAIERLRETAAPSRREQVKDVDVSKLSADQAGKLIVYLQGQGEWP